MNGAARPDACHRCRTEHPNENGCPPDPRVGALLGDKYRVLRRIGRGGMGAVYEGQHLVIGRRFAIKFLHADLVRRGDLLARFRREAYAAGSLDSENIASVVDFGIAPDGNPYLVMELLHGEDLASLLARERQLSVGRAINIVVQACRGLELAHAAGIVHRDLKPANLFVCRRGDGKDLIKILDFGIAKLEVQGTSETEGATSVTRTGSTMGTPFYMSPEQARGDKEIDHLTDIYGLGVILYEALTGERPHTGESYNAILYHILMQPPKAIGTFRPGLPAGLAAVVERALASERERRPASARELARELAAFGPSSIGPLESQFQLRPARESATVAPGGATAPAGPTADEANRVQSRLPRWAIALVAATAAVGLVLGVLFWARERRASEGGASPPRAASTSSATGTGSFPPTPPPSAAAVVTETEPPSAAAPTSARISKPAVPARRIRQRASSARPPAREPAAAAPTGEPSQSPRRAAFDRSDPYQ